MDRQEAIEVAKLMRQKFIEATEHMEANSLCVQAIDTLIAPIRVTDAMVDRAAKAIEIQTTPIGTNESWIGYISQAKAALTAALGGDDAAN